MYTEFSKRFKSLISQTQINEKQELFQFLTLNDQEEILTLEIPNKDSVFEKLLATLELLSTLSFSGLKLLKIKINQFQNTIDLALIQSIQLSLSSLVNLDRIEVFEYSSNILNPYSFFLFSSYEVSSPSQYFTFYKVLPSKIKRVICINSQFEDDTLYFELKYHDQSYSEQFSDSEVECFFEMVFEIAKEYSSFSPNKSAHPKIIEYKGEMPHISHNRQMRNSINLFRLWELEDHRIQRIQFQLQNAQGNSDLDQMNSQVDQRSFRELKQMNVFKKTKLFLKSINSRGINEFEFFIQALLFSSDLYFNQRKTFKKEQQQQYLSYFEEQNRNLLEDEKPVLRTLRVDHVNNTLLQFILKVVLMLPSLKNLTIDFKSLFQVYEHVEDISKGIQLVSKLDFLNFMGVVLFNSNKLELALLSEKNLKQFYPNSNTLLEIDKLTKSFSLQVKCKLTSVSNSNQENLLLVLEAIKGIFSLKSLIQFELNLNDQIPEIEHILSERNTWFAYIHAFKAYINPHMQFHPSAILLDLFL